MENNSKINYKMNMEMLLLAEKYCRENFSHEDIINELYNDNDLKKQLCLIELDKINSQNEADILVNNLTGKSGPIRETASYAILKLIEQKQFDCFFQSNYILDIFVKAITDINPSVSRNAIQIITFCKNSNYIYKCIIKEINLTLNNMEEKKQNHSYVLNKQNFNLYWNLEAIINIAEKITAGSEMLNILKKTAVSKNYTIREKTAKAALKLSEKNREFEYILDIMKYDENIYVQNFLNKN